MKPCFQPSGSSCDPKNFFVESSYLRSLFPEEVWVEILNWVKLLSPQDLENWSNSSPYFRHLLKDQRVSFLFPKVFQILAPKYEQHYPADPDPLKGNCYREDDDEDENVHELTGIMKCRLVCRSWNKAIQDYYEDPTKSSGGASHFDMKYDQDRIQFYDPERWKTCRFECFEPEETSPRRFFEHFEKTHYLQKNPFMGRSITIQDYLTPAEEDEEDMQMFLSGLDHVLRSYGEEVWYCKIRIDEGEADLLDPQDYPHFYLKLKEWLSRMPNLRSLKIVQEIPKGKDEWNCLEPLNDFMLPLANEMRENPLPKLGKLEFLTVENLVAPIFNQLIHQNGGHISGLEMERDEAHEKAYKYDLDYVLSGMPKLKRLGIHSFTEEELTKLEEGGGLRRLHLETFQLTDHNGFPFSWGSLMNVVNGLGESGTLTDLVLELPFVGNKKERDILELTERDDVVANLRNVERFVIFMGRPFHFDWLLPMKYTLRQLELVFPPYFNRVKGYEEVYSFTQQSKIVKGLWAIFGNLEVIKIGMGYLTDYEEWNELERGTVISME